MNSTLKTLALALGIVGLIGGGLMALDGSIQAKIDREVTPIREDVNAIREDARAMRETLEKILREVEN